jgi:S1-C subfamily serine protease
MDAPDGASEVLRYVHTRYRRRRRIQHGSFAIAAVVVVVAAVSLANVGARRGAQVSSNHVNDMPCLQGIFAATPSGRTATIDRAVVDINVTLPAGAAAGTGMIVTPSGEVLTTNNNVAGASTIKVAIEGSKKKSYDAYVAGYDTADDIAVLQIEGASNLDTVPVGDSATVKTGDAVTAVGNSGGVGGQPIATRGKIAGIDQTVTEKFQKPNTTIHGFAVQVGVLPGDEGGALLNAHGQVIAMIEALQGPATPNAVNTVVASPIRAVADVAAQICNGKPTNKVHVGATGLIGIQDNDSTPAGRGAVVASVVPNSAAARAGIVVGDTITSINGAPIADTAALRLALLADHPGDLVHIGWTDASGNKHSATITLGAGPPS